MEATRELIDEATGEILSIEGFENERAAIFDSQAGVQTTPVALMQPYLWRLGRAIRGIRRAADVENPRAALAMVQAEISRLEAVKQVMLDKLDQSANRLLSLAEEAMNRTDAIKVKLDGVGTFRYRKLPDKVTDGAIPFESLTEEQKESFHFSQPDLIKMKVSYQPDKKAIKTAIDGGAALPYFRVEGGGSKFEFAQE